MTYACDACVRELVAGPRRSIVNLDGTTGDAEVTDYTCPGCAKQFSHWRIPHLKVTAGGIVAEWKEMWFGDATPVVIGDPTG